MIANNDGGECDDDDDDLNFQGKETLVKKKSRKTNKFPKTTQASLWIAFVLLNFELCRHKRQEDKGKMIKSEDETNGE